MATENPPMNGTYANSQFQNHAVSDQSRNMHSATASTQEYSNSTAMANVTNSSTESPHNEIPPDEVGWYFVEQYYTTMSKSPEKLYLFYNKRSQFVSGSESVQLKVSVGQKAINDKIKDMDIQNCKVRVTNVDSQGSDKNIVIQVIGEISVKSAPQRKFTQTFVLAEQTRGYFVLNDIFRYIVEEEEELEGEDPQRSQYEAASGHHQPTATAVAEPEPEPQTLTNSHDESAREHDAQMVDQGLEAAIDQDDGLAEASVTANGAQAPESADPTAEEDTEAPVTVLPDEPAGATGEPTAAMAAEPVSQPEAPAAPEQTPAVSSPKQAPAQPVTEAPKSTMPKTWANLVAGSNNKTPPVAVPQNPAPASSSTANQPKVAPALASQSAAAAPVVNQDAETPTTPHSSGSEWQTARNDHGRKQARPQGQPPALENSRAYIKNIGENIDSQMLRTLLTRFGELQYLDINRQKNCAFADFNSPAAFQAAVASNPHEIGGERINVEERRVRPQSFGGFGPRGGAVGRGRGGMEGRGGGGTGRGGFQKDGRGGFPNRGRGNINPRGRGGQQQAT